MSTRSATLRTKSKLDSMTAKVDNAEMSNDDEASEEEGYSSQGSEYRGGRKGTARAPPVKRARGDASSAKTPAKKPSRARKSLSLLPTMPLDILFEIFGQLDPKDILSLSRTNKSFRKTLMTKNAITVWKTSLKQTGAPGCPPDMTEPGWVALLFGNVCQSCSAKNIQKVDFEIRRRVCTLCKKRNLITESKFRTYYPDYEKWILELTPCTHTGAWAHGHASSTRFFWQSDIERTIQDLAIYQHALYMRLPNAQKNLERFKFERIQLIEKICSDAYRYASWLEKSAMERHDNAHDLMTKRQNAIMERFSQLGYTEEDVSAVKHTSEFSQKADLTDRIWKRIQPILEPKLMEHKARRLQREYVTLKETRRKIVHNLYRKYKQTLSPSQWLSLPRTYDVCELSPFSQVINLPVDSQVTASDFDLPMQLLPELLATALDEKKSHRRCMLPDTTTESALEPSEISSSSALPLDILDKATSVFLCPYFRGHILIGVAAHSTHHCVSETKGLQSTYYYYGEDAGKDVVYSPIGSSVAESLVLLAGLDAKTISALDMDEGDYRFGCSRCGVHNRSGEWSRFAYSWRSAIVHAMEGSHNNQPIKWDVLTSSAILKVKQKEQAAAAVKWALSIWTCNHCTAHIDNLQTHTAILDHLRTEHEITDAKEPDDLFCFERNQPIPERMAYPVDAPLPAAKFSVSNNPVKFEFRCNHCSTSTQKKARERLFDSSGIQNHIAAKHNIRPAKEGTDFHKQEL